MFKYFNDILFGNMRLKEFEFLIVLPSTCLLGVLFTFITLNNYKMVSEIKLSPEFKNQTTKAIISIVLFIIIYFLLFLMAIGLTILCVYAAIMMVTHRISFITIVLGLGLASIGFLVLFFLIKFIFKSHKVDRSHLLEIKRTEEPALFKLIDSIVKQVDTSFPKKVYLSSDVNASVFYDSSFWSMFFPVRKNLQIGLGLVNSVSEAEFKAILAHEFGHFSQKTMKVGSYVYNVNQVIYNMLYDNEGYDKLVVSWANVSGYFAIFVSIAYKIVQGIQWVLMKVYGIINKNYMGLSREMEFHADEIAANVTGYEPLKNSLLRLELASFSYNSVISFYEGKIPENIKSENLFKEHSFVMNHFAQDDGIAIKNDLPQVTIEEINKLNKSKLVIKDQWASHPSTEDRIKRLESLNVPVLETEYAPANAIFSDIDRTQKRLTEHFFKGVAYKGEQSHLSLEAFQKDYEQELEKNSFAKPYNGYYDVKNPIVFDPSNINLDAEAISFEDLFSKQKLDLVYTSVALESDIQTLKQVSDNSIPLKTFDYDGIKYNRNECNKIIQKLEQNLNKTNEEIKQNDIEIFQFFKSIEKSDANERLIKKYKEFFAYEGEFNEKYAIYLELMNALQFVHYTIPIEEVNTNLLKVEGLEVELKERIKELVNNELFQEEMSEEVKDRFELYLSKKWQYFGKESYFESNLEILFSSLNNYAYLLSRGYFLLKKELLDYQIELLKKNTKV